MIPYGRHCIEEDDIEAVVSVLRSDNNISDGPKSEELESRLAEYVGTKYAVVVSSGTAALHAACFVAGLKTGDEVITSPNTFVSTAEAIMYCGARPVFADIDSDTHNISPARIRQKITSRTKAILPVDYAGQSCEMDEIMKIAKEHGLTVIEDGAEALGSEYKGRKTGTISDMTIFSFHAVKNITTCEGGAIVTNSREYYETFAGKAVPDKPIPELNAYMRKYLDDNFMLAFIDDAKKALIYSAEKANLAKEKAVKFLESKRAVFERENLDRKECDEACKLCAKEVFGTIDHMEIRKDSLVYTFGSGLRSEINKYFDGIRKNEKEKNRYAKQKAKYDALVEKGKEPDWQVVPASYTDLELAKQNILMQVDRLISHYKEILSAKEKRDFAAETVNVIDYLKENASGVVQKVTKRLAKEKAIKLMEEVGIPEPRTRYNQYPFEFSGGMRQRIVIAIALAANPDILICDEPTTALDVTIQAQILELINRLKKERNISVIFITHDLGVVANMADRVAVMYAGKIVEYGTAQDIFYEAAHPYTWALLSSMPDLDTTEKLDAIPGTPPNMIFPPKGDAFAARNKYALKIDFEKEPPMFGISDTHYAATWLLHPDAPKVAPPKIVTTRIERMKNRREAEDGR